MTMAVSVVVAVRNGARYIEKCIDSLAAQNQPCQIVVVNDGSTDETLQLVRPKLRPHDVLIDGQPQGLAQARNAGVGAATGEFIGFLDADAQADPNWTAEIASFLSRNNRSIMASCVLFEDNVDVVNGLGGVLTTNLLAADAFFGYHRVVLDSEDWNFFGKSEAVRVNYAMGNGLCAARELIEELGGFWTANTVYYDDVNFCLKARLRGVKTLANRKAKVLHKFGSTFKANTTEKLIDLERGRVANLAFFWKHLNKKSLWKAELSHFWKLPKQRKFLLLYVYARTCWWAYREGISWFRSGPIFPLPPQYFHRKRLVEEFQSMPEISSFERYLYLYPTNQNRSLRVNSSSGYFLKIRLIAGAVTPGRQPPSTFSGSEIVALKSASTFEVLPESKNVSKLAFHVAKRASLKCISLDGKVVTRFTLIPGVNVFNIDRATTIHVEEPEPSLRVTLISTERGL